MISNYTRLKVLLAGDRLKDPFWHDIAEYRSQLSMPRDGFTNKKEYENWRHSDENLHWSKEAAEELFRPRPGVEIELPHGQKRPTELGFPKVNFMVINEIARELAHKYFLDPAGSTYKKLSDVLLYNDTSLDSEFINQPVDLSSGVWDDGTDATFFVFNKHTRVENFIDFAKSEADMIYFFQSYLPSHKRPSFMVRFNSGNQSIEVRIFKNTKPTAIRKAWPQIKALQEQLDEYTPQTKDIYTPLLLAVDQTKGKLFAPPDLEGRRRLSMEEKLDEVKTRSGITIDKNQYKDYKRLVNRIKKGR